MEQDQRKKIVKALNKLKKDAISVENPALPGTPDVNYIGGWVELKYLERWPVKKETKVTLDHYTQQQRVWIMRRWYNQGAVWLCLQVSKTREWLVFDGETACKKVCKDNRNAQEHRALACFIGKSADEVAAYLTGNNNAHCNRLSK